MKTAKTLSWIVALFGLWEVIAPFLLGYSAVGAALWDAIIIGVVLIVLAGWAALVNQEGTIKSLNWINAVLGLWLIIAPFILAYSGTAAAMWNDIIVGVVVAVLAAWAALSLGSSQTMGHGQGHAA
ncbi:MAG TPA: hypothetical protein ENJ48_00805 [Anaerolineae bacterium]|nr:hypothetical protein [Anaerolineae bacterium]